MPDSLSLQFVLREDDLVRSWRHHFHTRVLRSKWAFWTAALLISYLFGAIGFALYCSDWSIVGAVGPIIATFPGLMAFNYFVVVPIAARRSDLPNRTFEVRVSNTGVAWQAKQIETSCSWSRFTDVVEGSEYFLLYFGQTTYFAIPKRAFREMADLVAFRDYVAGGPTGSTRLPTHRGNAALNHVTGDGKIVLHFRLSEKDEISVARSVFLRRVMQSRPTLMMYVVLSMLAMFGMVLAMKQGLRTEHIWMIAPGGIALSAVLSYLWRAPKRLVRTHPLRDCDQVAVVDDGGIVVDTGIQKTRTAWSSISDVREMNRLYLIFKGVNELTALSKRGFASISDETRFRDIVMRHVPHARISR